MSEKLQVIRLLSNRLLSSDERGLVLITGARQTGKTTLVKKAFPGLPYFNLDAMEFRDQLSGISTFSWAQSVGNAIFDEIQKEPSLIEKIKYTYDEGTISFSVLLGSAQLLLLSKIKESLAGRIYIYELFPLMLSELSVPEGKNAVPLFDLILKGFTPDEVFSGLSTVLLGDRWEKLTRTEDSMINWGGMPQLLHINSDQRKKEWLKSYTIAYLERDLGDIARLNDLKPFRKLQQIAALRAGALLSYSELAHDAGVSIETARRYLEYLRISYQVILVPPYSINLTSSIVKTPKIFWIDNGLLRELSGVGHQVIDGRLYENYVASEMIKYIRTSGSDAHLSFYRTRSGLEVDFCIESGKGLTTFEVKNRETVFLKDFTPMRRIADQAGIKWLGGIVVYRGNKLVKMEENLWAVPSARLFGEII